VYDAPPDRPRLVLDEASLRFDGLDAPTVTENIDQLADVLGELRRTGHPVAVSSLLYDVECMAGLTLADFLFAVDRRLVSPEVSRRLAIQFDRCPSWTSYQDEVTGDVWLDEQPLDLAFSVDYAILSTMRGFAVACVVFPACARRGPTMARNHKGAARIHFVASSAIVDFWRSLFADEDIPESGFFDLAEAAFPDLMFASNISFGRFAGAYAALREPVVAILGALNDHFADALAGGRGVAHQVQALLGRYGLDVSPESPGTRASPRLMKMRDVAYGGRVYRCEWHAKVERHRNRIHFALPQADLENRILIGIFVDHLDT
jgi:hypothetical protein